ncbi:hypothetical protein KUL25_13315 [Rhodobacteraceae bacterium N5(2021)]|uniref:Uncharacterized protein n=1 Tax=Gymnodinialimonas phycosphaerae TaxID=2841589 RepID=A0A975TRM9_9RHOB|nr:hypothetical protein [Gymnodinialimonas phycosphaerae]MBY4893744.1 hypothetical protein [Gymnodinialimonas phycosphaerae]
MMEPRLPGVWYASNRQTAFFLVPDGADRKAIFQKLFTGVETRRSTDGVAVENACCLTTPDGEVFHAITWQSKRLGAWRRDFAQSTQAQGIVTARFHGRRLMTSDGRRFWFRDLVVERR